VVFLPQALVSFKKYMPRSHIYCWTNKKLLYSLVKVAVSLLKLIKIHHKDENNYNAIHSCCCYQIVWLVCFKNWFMFVKLLFQTTSKNYSNHMELWIAEFKASVIILGFIDILFKVLFHLPLFTRVWIGRGLASRIA
jgi:hypothetical protein